ncbi:MULTISPECIES: class I SAM-dependent methyltransferase [unclassified Coleofasciculus]|uniref:class I SAM-dependent methyltransferase n=1 Tax=unclassified Coleofasciculus TaxID=2692782 RepID=UPI00187E188B|nr:MULTISPECIES: methyltransferase domain-containing protein [unclassified Coleofasciculus]MBE9126706.1 methyltransferase domain-containing protein [Coleofasciculus sp. LEGE 07081]MBE9150066.1 methyltransferase domain-containing protein [Coleofasciculus sp. LEGE 07092]
MTDEYLSKRRMISYYNQVRIIRSLGKEVKTILEIGIYNSLMSVLLTRNGYKVTTADANPELKPDILLDLQADFDIPKETFDAIVLFQVLEHIPYEYFEKNLIKLADATKRFIVISIPCSTVFFSSQFHTSFALTPRHFLIQLPKFWSSQPWTDEHYWEMGLKGYPKKRIVSSIKNVGLLIKREFQDPYHPYHYFFVLEKNPKLL